MWLSRLYLATEFMHQCVLGSCLAYVAFRHRQRYLLQLYAWPRCRAIMMIILLGCLALAVYFIKLRLQLDPHWSVRQAFKWCPEPTYMRHEASPIFLLSRDLGYLLGFALALPLAANNSRSNCLMRRLVVIGTLAIVNHMLQAYTPKQFGRFAFLAYEFSRNALYSLMLFKFLPRLAQTKEKCS
ncbi:CG15400 [Drosophila busckii]|uniref:CG15400 n=2 Tax=Drosophila busckii TaxID=30019 RepID=A0A0M4EGH7_DROBS|nr:CG15400 [Drosophila busckii]